MAACCMYSLPMNKKEKQKKNKNRRLSYVFVVFVCRALNCRALSIATD